MRETLTLSTAPLLTMILLAGVAGAATPATGTASAAGETLSWEGGPLTAVNPTTATCVEGVSCDTFTLELIIPDDEIAAVDFGIEWASSTDDFDLFIFDESGAERGFSAAGDTTSEATTVDGLAAGTYRVVTNAFATANASYSGQLTIASVTDAPDDTIGKTTPRVEFDDDTIVDFSAVSGEPFVRLGNDDDIFVTVPFGLSTSESLLWVSRDGGESYIPLGAPIARDSVTGPGGGDSHVDFDAANRLYFIDLGEPCVTAAVSLDGGNTFPLERTNSVMCLSEEHPESATDDRQWIGAFGDGVGYATWRNLFTNPFWIFKTDDAGLSWDGGTQLGTVDQSGPFQVDKTKRPITVDGVTREAILSYQVYYDDTNVRTFRIADFDDGSPLVIDDLSIADPGESVSNVFPQLAIDVEGNLYAAWSQGARAIFMATSTDRGETWSDPIRVSQSSGTNIMPWIVAGDPGRVDIVWYRSPVKGNRDLPETTWDVLMAQSVKALHKKPKFRTVVVNDTLIHRGEICLRGLNCDIDGADRSFLEFPSVSIDSRGAAVVTFNDNTNQVAAPYVMVSKQTAGPSLFESVRTIDGAAAERGRDVDEAGDARFPDHGAVIGTNIPVLDIRSTELSDDGDSITATIEVADLSMEALSTAPTRSGGDGILFLTQWDFDDDVHWVAAEIRGGEPVFLTGDLGSIDSTGPKFITYRPDLTASSAVTGRIVEGAPGVIEITVPKSLVGDPADGDELFIVTSYAFSERGPLVPESSLDGVDSSSLPVQIDASGSYTYEVASR